MNVGNVIILMILKVGIDFIFKDNLFCEEKLFFLYGVWMKLVIFLFVEKEVVLLGDYKISVVKDVVFDFVVDDFVNFLVFSMVVKRKLVGFLK